MRIISINNSTITNSFPTFLSSKSKKLIEKLEKAEQLNKVKITFDELERMYEEIGYYVIKKRGSHAIVNVTENLNIPVIIPHGRKHVHPNDLKRFLLVKEKKFKEASLVN
jgi:predicted RNA binding protein YcfA (HicA-like mRNA interferase family)